MFVKQEQTVKKASYYGLSPEGSVSHYSVEEDLNREFCVGLCKRILVRPIHRIELWVVETPEILFH